MKRRTTLLALVLTALLAVPAAGGPKPKAPCRIFFQIGQNDAGTVNQTMWGMTDNQGHWWFGNQDRKTGEWWGGRGDKGKYAGICFLGGEMPVDPELPPNTPVYSIVWGYSTYDTLSQGTTVAHLTTGGHIWTWDYSANGGKGAFVRPVAVADTDVGVIAMWHTGDEDIVLLKTALQAIIDGQKAARANEPWRH